MKKALAMMAALMANMGNEATYDFLGVDKPKRTPKKVWNAELKCYTIEGKPIKKEEGKDK